VLRVARDLPRPLIARSVRDGDAWSREGSRARPLKEAFADARWSLRERARAVVVECGGEVVWVAGLGRVELSSGREAAWELSLERLSGAGVSC
jgi:hypothetical protein